MQKHLLYALAGLAATAVAGSAIAADQAIRTMHVPLADGSTIAVEYVGDVAPKVTVIPATPWPVRISHRAMPGFANLDRMIADMNRRSVEVMRRMREMRNRDMAAGIPGMNLASAGSLPAGASSVSVVTVSNGGKSCTRTTEVVSQGQGKPPRVTSNVSGDCGPRKAPGSKAARAAVPTA